jgi:hypothetical protein
MLLLCFQGLALLNPNIDALSKKIHLLQSHWDTVSMPGRMLHQAYQVFQVKVELGRNIFPNPLFPLADFPPMGSFIISGNSSIDMESCFVSLQFRYPASPGTGPHVDGCCPRHQDF